MSSLTSSTLRFGPPDPSAARLLVSLGESLTPSFPTGCNTGLGGADIQGPVHWQRRHVETEEESGRAGRILKCDIMCLFT